MENKDLRICVLHRGWVLIGLYEKNGEMITLKDPYVIRRWKTSKGLGQLALEGPGCDPLLDKETENEIHQSQCIRTIKCDIKLWGKYYG